jgi:uncharacterized protein YraI
MPATTRTLISAAAALTLSTAAAMAWPATATGNINLRAGPGTGHPAIGTLRRGEVVDVIGCAGSWCEIDLGRGSGFASASYLARDGRRTYRSHRRAPRYQNEWDYYDPRNFNYRDDDPFDRFRY